MQSAEPQDSVLEDCQFGDGGAAGLIAEPAAGSGSSEIRGSAPANALAEVFAGLADRRPAGETERRASGVQSQALPVHASFLTLFQGMERRFALDGGWVHLAKGLSLSSTGIVAEVFDASDTKRLGTISTAEALGSTRGLKAICDKHKGQHQNKKQCLCWLRYRAAHTITEKDRWQSFRVLCDWIASATTCDLDEHQKQSRSIREAIGMKPRGTAA